MSGINQTHILLDEKEFEQLIRGKVLDFGGTKIALQDIGYDLMIGIVMEAIRDMHQDQEDE